MTRTVAVLLLAVFTGMSTNQSPRQAETVVLPAALRQRIGVDEAKMRRHVVRPAHILNASSDDWSDDAITATTPRAAVPILPAGRRAGGAVRPAGPALDVARFASALHEKLKSSAAGYVMRMQKNGTHIYTLQWNWARGPADGSVGWTPGRRMHIASVSKLITAIGMAKALDEKGISYDAKIIDYLPAHWTKGSNINQITFRHLLTHRSGFSTGGSGSDYALMKAKVAEGVAGTGMSDYENMNFGLCRILIPFVLYGGFLNAFTFSDQTWDYITITGYTEYMQNKVFGPSGVTGVTLASPSNGALAYAFPVSGPGWNSGDLSSVSGGAGWHMSPNELLRVLATFRHKGTILSTAKAQALLDASLGIDQIHDTPAGRIYNKNGRWTNGGRDEQSVAFVLPDGMELVLFVNSRIAKDGGPDNVSLRNLVRETFVAYLK